MWSGKATMQINADRSKIMVFHETAQQKNASKNPMKKGGQNMMPCPIPPAVIIPRQEIRATTVRR